MRKFFYIPMTLVVSACGGGDQSAPTDPQQANSTATCAETSPGDLEVSLPFAMRCYTESEYAKAVFSPLTARTPTPWSMEKLPDLTWPSSKPQLSLRLY